MKKRRQTRFAWIVPKHVYTCPQELYRWPEVADAGRKALSLRYALLPYLYAAMHDAARGGCPAFRALWFNHPDDAVTLDIDRCAPLVCTSCVDLLC